MSSRKVMRLSNDRVRAKVVADLFQRCRETGKKFVVATTGGGGGLAKWILGMPGASACLVEYRVSAFAPLCALLCLALPVTQSPSRAEGSLLVRVHGELPWC